tara:strand:- start:4660 stop:7956 length:3297 start_codon:yes stop_codon:yes gene_type:complete
MENAYTTILDKLQSFIQKYYQNILIKGLILSFGFSAIGFIGFALLEHYGRFGVLTRTCFFWSFVVLSSLFFMFRVVWPILRLFRLGKRISDHQAAQIIGHHFPEVADKLLNVIQLKTETSSDQGLVEASIIQKSNELNRVPFVGAVNFRENKKFAKYVLIPLFVFVGLLASDREDLLTESTARILDYKTEYISPAPFHFNILNSNLECVQHQDFTLSLQLSGSEIPTEVFLDIAGQPIKMNNPAQHLFEFKFKNIQQSQVFKFNAGGIYSSPNTLTVLKAPSLLEFELSLNFPKYLGKAIQTLRNVGEIFVPEGTNVNWNFFTDNTDTLKIVWGKQPFEALQVAKNQFRFTKKAKESLYYKVLASNNKVSPQDSLNYMFKVLKDAYPIIDAIEVVDSTQLKMKYFKGEIRDDYGFEKLLFVIENGHTGWDSIVPLKININVNKDNFFFVFDMRDNQVGVEDYFEYHFEVYDNDGVNGSKMSQSRSFEFKIPSKEVLQKQQEEKTEELKADLEQSVNLAKELQEEFEELRKKLLTKEELSWEDKQQIKGVLDKQRLLEKSIDYVAQQNKKKNAMKEQFSKQDQRIIDKQTQLQELMDDLMTEEMRQLFDDMEEMMDDMKTDDWMQKLEEIQMSNEDLEKELDRNLEMLKKFEFEEALEKTIEELQELIDKQEQLKEANDNRIQPQEETTKLQEELRDEFDKVSEKIDELHRKNQSLEKQENLSLTEDLQNKVSEKMQESVQSSQNNKRKKTSEAQKSSVYQMQKLQEKLKQAQASPSESGPPEDMNALRQILENLIDLSLDEERLLTELSEIKTSDPQYVDFIFWQNKLSDDSKVLEDSLYALSKRQAQIKATINREMSAINKSIKKSLANMSERETSLALNHQQLVMTSANNLALMLSDILQSMQEDMANKTPGEQQCNKPGSGNPSPGDIKKMQEQLKKQMEQMKKGGGQEKKPKPSQGKDLAIMMARQEMIRHQLEKMAEKLQESENSQTKRLQDAIEKMEQTEVDIVNDNITKETLFRQNQIIEHLLQAEKADQERDKDSKRESKEGRPLPHQVEDVLIEYQEIKRKQAELLKTIPPTLKPFYKSRVNDYFLNLE